jgi:UDP-N-acetylmuramoylalanine--D-glutamate ligase
MSNSAYASYENQAIALVGYGVTGKACYEFLLGKKARVSVFDKAFADQKASNAKLNFYPLDENVELSQFDTVVVSPGVNLAQTFIKNFLASGESNSKQVIGDIELFAREHALKNESSVANQKTAKVIAVTGSNGKSTVVDMLAKALTQSGFQVALGGNFGTSALSFLSQSYDYIVLELSSFQLESTYSLRPDIACILNISADHLDRHGNIETYASIKHRIYQNAVNTIFNRDDDLTKPKHTNSTHSFGLNRPQTTNENHSFYQTSKGIWLNNELLLDSTKLNNNSQFQLLNMQVVLACANILDIELPPVIDALLSYSGLPHRFQVIHESANTVWINDSKATNPGACLAAIESASQQFSRIVLIAGGDAKGADASVLKEAIEKNVDMVVVIGKDAALFTQFNVPYQYANSLEEAVFKAKEYVCTLFTLEDERNEIPSVSTVPASAVLLSPACASIDMFNNYQERGEVFSKAVLQQVAA